MQKRVIKDNYDKINLKEAFETKWCPRSTRVASSELRTIWRFGGWNLGRVEFGEERDLSGIKKCHISLIEDIFVRGTELGCWRSIVGDLQVTPGSKQRYQEHPIKVFFCENMATQPFI